MYKWRDLNSYSFMPLHPKWSLSTIPTHLLLHILLYYFFPFFLRKPKKGIRKFDIKRSWRNRDLNSDSCDANTVYYQLYYFPLDPILVIGIYYSFIIFLFFFSQFFFSAFFVCAPHLPKGESAHSKNILWFFVLQGQRTKET